MGEQSYRQILQAERGKILPDRHPLTRTVDRVLQRLIPYSGLEGLDWKVHVIQDDQNANAFVIPGGKVFVYTGMLPICKNEDGIAAVLGHEIAHTVAHHPAERMSSHFLSMGMVFLVALFFDVSSQLSSIVLDLMWSLPNSRTQESEADQLGLMMMAKACYNPEAAADIWAAMQKREKMAVAPPQFMSTHPSSYNREEAIRGLLDKANDLYAENGCSSSGRYVPGFYSAFGRMN